MPAREHPFAFLRKRADVKKCCGDPKNLYVEQPQPDIYVARCLVCRRTHRKLICDSASPLAATFRTMGTPLGK